MSITYKFIKNNINKKNLFMGLPYVFLVPIFYGIFLRFKLFFSFFSEQSFFLYLNQVVYTFIYLNNSLLFNVLKVKYAVL